MLTPPEAKKIRDFLCTNGYAVVPNVLTPEFVDELRKVRNTTTAWSTLFLQLRSQCVAPAGDRPP